MNATQTQEAPGTLADIVITPANVVPSSAAGFLSGDVYAAEAVSAGDVVYDATAQLQAQGVNTLTYRYVKRADNTTNPNAIGMAAASAAYGQPVRVITRDPALALGIGAAGDVAYLSAAVGKITSTYADIVTGKFVVVLGVCNGPSGTPAVIKWNFGPPIAAGATK